jgi:hypothetical protein
VIWIAAALWVVSAGFALALTLLGLASPDLRVIIGLPVGPAAFVLSGLIGIGYATAGILILRQRIRHTVGWVLAIGGPLMSATLFANALGQNLAREGRPLAVPFAFVSELTFWPALLVVGPMLAFVFPDGRLPSRRWGLPLAVLVGGSLVAVLVYALTPGRLYTVPVLAKPLGVLAVEPWLADVVVALNFVFVWLILLAAATAVVVRFRRAGGEERQQLKWFTYALFAWVTLFVAAGLLRSDEIGLLSMAGSLLVPTAIVVAVSRYRLYEIDTLINRTLVYLPLLGIVAGLYAAFVILFQRLLANVTGDTSDAAAIMSALVLAAVFHPIRKLIEGFVDRHFKTAPNVMAAGADAGLLVALDDPRFEAAVERVVRRVGQLP